MAYDSSSELFWERLIFIRFAPKPFFRITTGQSGVKSKDT